MALILLYVPGQASEVQQAFWDNTDQTIRSDEFVLEYTYRQGSAIDERLIVVTSK